MNEKMSKPNVGGDSLSRRLDGIRMSPYERLIAQAQLERAEVLAEMCAAAARSISRAYKALTARSPRRPAPSAG